MSDVVRDALLSEVVVEPVSEKAGPDWGAILAAGREAKTVYKVDTGSDPLEEIA